MMNRFNLGFHSHDQNTDQSSIKHTEFTLLHEMCVDHYFLKCENLGLDVCFQWTKMMKGYFKNLYFKNLAI